MRSRFNTSVTNRLVRQLTFERRRTKVRPSTKARNPQLSTVGAHHLLISARCKLHRRQVRSRPSLARTAVLLVLLTLLLPSIPARADDPIGQWLKQDEADGQNDEVRPDLNALTDQQLRDIFKVWPEQADSPELIERGRQEPMLVLYIWLIAIVAGFGAVIGAVKIGSFPRSHLRTLVIPVQMKGQSY